MLSGTMFIAGTIVFVACCHWLLQKDAQDRREAEEAALEMQIADKVQSRKRGGRNHG